MTTEQKIEKQMGCMSGFLQIFDRHQLLSGKRLNSTKRLPPPKCADASPEAEKITKAPAFSNNKLVSSPAVFTKEVEKPPVTKSMTFPIPDLYRQPQSPEPPRSPLVVPSSPPKSPLPLPLFDVNDGGRNSWKFSPRLSLDSRATFDAAKGSLYRKQIQTNSSIISSNSDCDNNNRRSTSVIAKLMGIEPLPNSSPEPVAKLLRRSASESRVSRDIFQSRIVVDSNSDEIFKTKQQQQQNHITSCNVIRENINVDPMDDNSLKCLRSDRSCSNRGIIIKSPHQRKSFFNSADVFPEPIQTVSIYGEIERRLRMRGIDEPSKDLETLKQILEAMQLKGLLHSKPTPQIIRNKNIVSDTTNYSKFSEPQSPIVLMKPLNGNVRTGTRGSGVSSVSPRRQRHSIDQNVNSPIRARSSSSPTRTEISARSSNSRSNSPVKTPKQLTIDTQRRVNESVDSSRRVSPRASSPRRNVADQAVTNRSPRNRRSTSQINTVANEDESSSSLSESTVSTPSQTDMERSKTREYKEGKRLLDRCDKLLNSIAEMNSVESQPSPVSVLDSSFYKDDSSSSPSPVMKRNISFSETFEEEMGSPGISSVRFNYEDEINDPEFIYISKILKALSCTSEDLNDHIFSQLEKQYMKCKYPSKVSKLQRRLIFDIITEIIEHNRNLSPWKAFATKTWNTSRPSVRQIWSEFQRIRQQQSSDDLFEVICGVLKKDLAGDTMNGWGDCHVEMSEAVLDIERLIFKDLVGELIRDLADLAANTTYSVSRRKLKF